MSRQEKEWEQEDAYTKTQSHSKSHPYIFCYAENVALNVDITIWQRKKYKCILTSKCLYSVWCSLERNKDVVRMGRSLFVGEVQR